MLAGISVAVTQVVKFLLGMFSFSYKSAHDVDRWGHACLPRTCESEQKLRNPKSSLAIIETMRQSFTIRKCSQNKLENVSGRDMPSTVFKTVGGVFRKEASLGMERSSVVTGHREKLLD